MAAQGIFGEAGDTGVIGEKVKEDAIHSEVTLADLAPLDAERKRTREELLLARGALAAARECLRTAEDGAGE